MTAPSAEIRAETSRLRTTEPKEGTTPSPRDPVAARALIGSITEERSREIRTRMRSIRDEYRRLALELVTLEGVGEFLGLSEEEG